MTKRAVLYARVAVGGEGTGRRELTSQLDACRKHAQDRCWEIVAELAEDERGVSGHSLDRPQLNCMLEMARASEFDVLIVHNLYRLTRELANLLSLEHELKQQGIQIDCAVSGNHEMPATTLLELVAVELPAAKHRRRSKVINKAQDKG